MFDQPGSMIPIFAQARFYVLSHDPFVLLILFC